MIREAALADIDALVALVNGAFRVERFFVDGDRTSAADVRARLGAGHFLVAEGGGGALDAAVYLEPRGARAYLGMLSVAPAQQGRGLGRVMLDTAEAWCRTRGFRAIDILVVNLRTELFPIYEKRGYVRRGTVPFPAAPAPLMPCHFVELAKQL